MDDLAERLNASMGDPNGEPWFPQLTADLVARAWDNLYRDTGLTLDSYSTERVLSRSILAPREIIASLKTCPTTCATSSAISVEALTPKTLMKYRDQGANFYSQQEILGSALLSCLEEALVIIREVPSLMKTVSTLVRSLHVIKPENPEYDVSFSEPHVPFSIFISVPKRRLANDALRVAEAIVHEAMHLQLTLLERSVLLVASIPTNYYSPWRGEYRNAQGILHGLYVFSVVSRVLELVRSTCGCPADWREHIQKRCADIDEQFCEVRSFQRCPELTPTGIALVRLLMLTRVHGYLKRAQ